MLESGAVLQLTAMTVLTLSDAVSEEAIAYLAMQNLLLIRVSAQLNPNGSISLVRIVMDGCLYSL
jgi:hypothetical protein